MILNNKKIKKINQYMLGLGKPIEKDNIGYNAIDYPKLEILGRYNGDYTDEMCLYVLNTFLKYKGKQLKPYKKDIKESIEYYSSKVKSVPANWNRFAKEEGPQNFLPNEITFLGKEQNEYGTFAVLNWKKFYGANIFRDEYGKNSGHWSKNDKNEWCFCVNTDYLQQFLENVRWEGDFGFVPDKNLLKFIEEDKIESKNVKKVVKQVAILNEYPNGIDIQFDGFISEINDLKFETNQIRSFKNGKEWATFVGNDYISKVIHILQKNNFEVSNLLEYENRDTLELNKADNQLIDYTDKEKYPLPFTPYPYQIEDANKVISQKRILLGHDMGCVSGNSKVQIKEQGKESTRRVTITNLQRLFDKDETIQIKSLVNGRFAYMPIKGIYEKGIQETIKIYFEDTYLECTKDHKIYTPNGWVEAGKLKIYDDVFSNGQLVCPKCGATKDIIHYKYSKFYGYCRKCSYKYRNNGHGHYENEGLVKQIDKNGYVRLLGFPTKEMPSYDKMVKQGGVYEHHQVWYENTGHIIDTKKEVIHHKNGIKTDNRFENLQLMTIEEHTKYHASTSKKLCQFNENIQYITKKNGTKIYLAPRIQKITKIEQGKTQMVYDIAIKDDEIHNFVCNGIVVHNCGKTLIAALVGTSINVPKLVIVPESLRLNWKREILNLTPNADIKVLYSKNPFEVGTDWTIVGYSTATKYYEQLAEQNFDCIFIDEAHNCKAVNNSGIASSKRAESVLKLCEKATYVYPMTGTPLPTRNKDLFNILRMLKAPEVITGNKNDFFQFGKTYCDGKHNGYGWDFSGQSNSADLSNILNNHMVRRLKSDVLPDLTKQRVFIPIEATQKAYFRIEYKINNLSGNDTYMGLAMTGRRILSKDKVEASIDLADTLLEGEDSVVIVSEFDETLDKIQEKYGDLCCTIRGGMTDKAKQQAIDDFQSGTKKVCALNMIAGGVGITLTKAHHMIICDYDWTPSNMAQVEDRICRSGQKDPCMIHYIYCENALLDQIFMKMITDKSYNIDRIVDKAENTMDFNVSDGNYLKTLENCINELKENRLRKIFENNFSDFHYEITSSPFGCDIFIDDKQLHLSRTKLYDIMNENTDEEITQKISDTIIQFQNELEIGKE